MTLTQSQYRLIMAILRELPATLTGPQDKQPQVETVDAAKSTSLIEKTPVEVDEEEKQTGTAPSSLSLRFNVPAVRLELFDAKAISKAKLDGHSIIRFEIDDVVSTFDTHADGSQVADVKLAAVTLSNTRPGASLYRDFLPRSTSEDSQM
jgi:vacuolar protein sorting-associated protein 13A/C